MDKMKIRELVEAKLQDSNSFLVDLQVKPGNLVVVEIDNEEGVDIAECMAISRVINEAFDRDVEDFELEVGSAGVTSPFKVLKQYLINIGNSVEVLSRAGIKLKGTLLTADENGFTVGVSKKVKPEGSKKKIEVIEEVRFAYDEVKYCKYHMDFK